MSRREFHCTEGGASKFWAITVEGTGFAVQFGKIGTKGQSQTKEFPSADAARQAADKLIAEKTKKGYAEVGAGAASPPLGPSAPADADQPRPTALPELAAPESASPPPIVSRSIDLDPGDWQVATWRPRQPLLRPHPPSTPKPFDLAACLAQVAAIHDNGFGWWEWHKVPIPDFLTPEEAHFWFVAMTESKRKASVSAAVKRLAKGSFDGRLSPQDAIDRIKACDHAFVVPQALRVLTQCLSPWEVLEVLQDEGVVNKSWDTATHLLNWFTREVFPYLPNEVLWRLRGQLRPQLDPNAWPDDPYKRPPLAFHLAALVGGLHEELLTLVAGWPDGSSGGPDWGDYYHQPQRVVFGLGEPRLVDSHMRRLKLLLKTPEHVRSWLAHTEYAGLDYVRDCVLAETNKDDTAQLLKVFCLVKAPEAAPFMLDLVLHSKAPKLARQWLDEQVGHAVAGLIPAVAGRGKVAEAAVEYLREVKRKGLGAFLEEQLKQASPEVADKVRREVLAHTEKHYEPFDDTTTPEWLRTALAEKTAGKSAKLPEWVRLTALPPLTVGDHCLSEGQTQALLQALGKSPLGAPLALVKGVKEHADAAARDAFAWRLFELWRSEGAPSKEKWAMAALGHLGSDAAALKLTPLVRAWPGESQHARAVLGLECLRAVGSDTALMQLNGIAQKLKFKGLQNKAREFMDAIAADRGLSRTQLEDRIVPDLDLDDRGSKVFDFGPRQFRLVLGPDLAPQVVGDDAKAKADLPKPGGKDAAGKANAAIAEWKLLKKQLRDVVKIQAGRLEQAMVTGRRWSVAEFETLLVRHPLMVNLVRRLVWGGYDGKGQLLRTFRVSEEREPADEHDQPCTLEGVTAVGIVHPLHLAEAQRAKWGEVFSDYEILSPFPQLGRPVYGLEAGEDRDITRFSRLKIPSLSVAGTLERLGWERGYLHDHGDYHEHVKHFDAAGVTAVVEYEPGLHVERGFQYAEEQNLTHCYFIAARQPTYAWDQRKAEMLPLRQVDPVAVSEVLADLTELASKGK